MNGPDRTDRELRRHRRTAAAAIAAFVLITALIFLRGHQPGEHYEIDGLFATATQLSPGSDVRIAGVSVGRVSAIDAGPGTTARVTIRIEDRGRPVHADATLAVTPRLVLEGNAYIKLRPGSPAAPELRSGATVPLGQTSVPVQLDQVLDTFEAPTRRALHDAIASFAQGLGPAPGATGGSSGAKGARASVRALDRSLRSFQVVARSLRGTESGDVSDLLRGGAQSAQALAADPAALADLVTNVNRVTGTIASRDSELGASLRGLDATLAVAPPTLDALDRALPTLTRAALSLRPSLRRAPATLGALIGFIDELEGLFGRSELAGAVPELRPVTRNTPDLERRVRPLLPLVTSLMECTRTRVVPALDEKLQDGPNTTGDPAWLDLAHSFAGAEGAAPTFDGNGVNVRVGVTAADQTFTAVFPGFGQVVGNGTDIQGVRPTWLGYGVEPPYRPDEPCTRQALPDMTKRSGPAPVFSRRVNLPRLTRLPTRRRGR